MIIMMHDIAIAMLNDNESKYHHIHHSPLSPMVMAKTMVMACVPLSLSGRCAHLRGEAMGPQAPLRSTVTAWGPRPRQVVEIPEDHPNRERLVCEERLCRCVDRGDQQPLMDGSDL